MSRICKKYELIDSWGFTTYFGSRDIDTKITNIILGFDTKTDVNEAKLVKDDVMEILLKKKYSDIQVYIAYRWVDSIYIKKTDQITLDNYIIDAMSNAMVALEKEYESRPLKIIIAPNENETDYIIEVNYCFNTPPSEKEKMYFISNIIEPIKRYNPIIK